jgi:hypothetical protein
MVAFVSLILVPIVPSLSALQDESDKGFRVQPKGRFLRHFKPFCRKVKNDSDGKGFKENSISCVPIAFH